MARRRKINIQRNLGAKGASAHQAEAAGAIDQLSESMSTTNVGFRPTDQRVYEINLDRIWPDPAQPRHLLPHDLRAALQDKTLIPAEVIRELVLRAERNDIVALLILGGKEKGPANEEDEIVEDTGLLALAQSIREIGLRQPINVYRIDDPEQPHQTSYQLGEGERRYWAHHLLVQQGYEDFNAIKCIVEVLPDDEDIIHQRQEAENAARVDLPAIARARSINRIKERLNIELGTRVPGENTIKLPSQRELQIEVGQHVKSLTGRAIGDRMVRNYLSLLNLSLTAQDMAEAGQLTEKQLRPVLRLKSDEEQLAMIRQIIDEKWSSRKIFKEILSPTPKTSLREISQTTVEQRFEKRVLDAAKTMHSLLSLPQENYDDVIAALAVRAGDKKMRQAIQSLRQTLEEILLRVEQLTTSTTVDVNLISVLPPLKALKRHLPAERFEIFETDILAGAQILDQLIKWRQEDAILASHLDPFFNQIESDAESLRAGEPLALPILAGERNPASPELVIYEVQSGASIYWAHELLVKRGEDQFNTMKAEVIDVTFVDD